MAEFRTGNRATTSLRHRGRGRPWWLGRLLLGGAVAAAVGIAVLPRLLATPDRVSRLIAAAVPELQADVRIGRIRLGWFGPIVVEDVVVVPRDGTAAPLAIARLQTTNGLAAILLSAGDLGTLRVERPRASIVFDADHASNLSGLFAPHAGSDGGAGGAARRAAVRFAVEIDDAVVQMSGPWADEPWVSEPIDVRAALRPAADGRESEWTIEPVRLLADARLEPAVAHGVLAYIAPVLADATRTGGRFSLRLDGGRFPVGNPASGTVAGELAMHEVVLGPGPLVANLVRALPGRLPEPPAIKLADESRVTFRLADRRVFHEGLRFGLPLARAGQRLDINSRGSVGVDDRSLDLHLSVPIPEGLPEDRPLLASLAGKTVSLGIAGELGAPEVRFDGSIAATAKDVVGELIDRLRERNGSGTAGRGTPPAPNLVPAPPPRPRLEEPDPAADRRQAVDPTAAAVVDVVGDLLDEIAKRRAERRAAERAATDDPVPPRRGGRLLRRLLVPPPPAADGGDAASPPQPEPDAARGRPSP